MLSFYKLKSDDVDEIRQKLNDSFYSTPSTIEKFLGNPNTLIANHTKTIFLIHTKINASVPISLSWKLHTNLPSTEQYSVCGILVMSNVNVSLSIRDDSIPSLEIKTLHISSKWRGRGYDSILLEKVLNIFLNIVGLNYFV